MKTKTKTLAILEIAIVLCSLLLVALPSIAAEQNQEMQEVSASTITTTASEDDATFTLAIYGNANEDDTIDMRDTTYIKLAIFGKKPKTELSDANNDGKVSMLDVGQTKLIILGKEKELTVLDTPEESKGRLPEAVTIQKPVERVVVSAIAEAETLRSLNAVDMIVGVGDYIKAEEFFFPELSKLPSVGRRPIDYEVVLNLHPDIYFGTCHRLTTEKDKLPGVAVMCVDVTNPIIITRDIRKLGYILDRREEAEEFINWHDDWMNHIKERTEGLSEDEKPKVFYWDHFKPGGPYSSSGRTKGSRFVQASEIAGGINIMVGLPSSKIDPEFVIAENPDVILARPSVGAVSGYNTDDPSVIAAGREDILSRAELAKVTAVVEEEVYLVDRRALANAGSGSIVCIAYFAKWLQPDLFEDLNPEAIHREYLGFQRFDFDLDEHGIFAYPPIEVDDGLAGIPDRYKGQI